MSTSHPRVLIVRLPCKKVYPIGPIYLAGALNHLVPAASLRLLDLALVEPKERNVRLLKTIQEHRPDFVAFSWRDLQIFSPQDMDGAMRDAFTFFYDPSAAKKVRAASRGLDHILRYRSAISENLSLIRETCRNFSNKGGVKGIALGGSSVRIFGDWLSKRLPSSVRMFPESSLGRFYEFVGLPVPRNLVEPGLNLEALEVIFPEWRNYREEQIGVQSKQGCPQTCLYCLYGFLEGREVRRRDPVRVIDEIEAYFRRWGARWFWFSDAQLLSERKDADHLSAILEGLLRKGIDIRWSGYLRIDGLDPGLADLMVRSGLCDLEVSLNSGSQIVLDRLRMGFSLQEVMKGFEILKRAGYPGRVLVNLSVNSPGETRETLMETINVVRRIQGIFGEDRVVPVLFFLAIQPNTGLEKMALEEGRIKKGYDPLSPWPWDVHKLIYNPPPLGSLIGRCCALAFRRYNDKFGETILGSIENSIAPLPSSLPRETV